MFRKYLIAGTSLLASSLAGGSSAAIPQAAKTGDYRVRAEAILQQMTPEEKAAQLQIFFAIGSPKEVDDKVGSGTGAMLFVTDPKEVNRLQRLALEKSRLRIPVLFGFDVIHGLSTIFPVPIGMAASWDPDLAMRSQAVAAEEASSVGINWAFGPMIDISRDPRWGRMVEGPGEDPYLASALAAAQVRGFQGPEIGTPGRVIAGPKHFAGYGASIGGRDYDEAEISDEQLHNTYLPPFKAAVEAGAGNIMTAYMALNGIPATGNRWLLTDVLRKDWGFTGWTVSDNNAVSSLRSHGFAADPTDAAVRGLTAGVDMEMSFARGVYGNLPAALQAGRITQQQLDTSVRRILEAKFRLGLFDKPFVDETKADKTLRSANNLAAAQRAAERSAVLLKNEGALLPLDRKKLKSVAVIGPLGDSPRDALGPWVFAQNKPATHGILEGIREKLGSDVAVSYSPGVAMAKRLHPSPLAMATGVFPRPEPKDDPNGIAEAVAAAHKADVAIMVLGEAQDMTGELASRSSLDLPGRQQELLDAVVATGKPVVVVLLNGRPLDLKDTKAGAILEMWYPGSRAGAATANLLFGDAVPGGKLPFTWPRNAAQAPMYYSHLTTHSAGGINQRYWNESNAPVYPFGHGLSYSTFEYSEPKLNRTEIGKGDTLTISVDLRNTGARAADEVAQLYVHQRYGTAARPVRELKGFSRVTLKPGELRTLTFKLGPNELRYWNASIRDWVIDAAAFEVAVGGSSTAPFKANFTVVDKQ